jgi:protease-4
VSEARPGDTVQTALEDGPWFAEAAVEKGLVDAVGYEDDARRELTDAIGDKGIAKTFGVDEKPGAARAVAEILRAIAGVSDEDKEPRIAVVVAEGSIAMESGGPFSDDGIAVAPLTKVIRRLRKDDSCKAVVLRIVSPGGSALASDLLWHELEKLAAEKPLVASMGNVAASGGYWIATAAQEIVAEPTSIVGSIGVVGGKIVIGDALAEFGVQGYTFSASDDPKRAARASYMSLLDTWDEPTRERIRDGMVRIYDLFIERVATARSMQPDAVRKVAEGRIWTGVQGKELGLVDHLGGLAEAIERARELGSLDADLPVELEGAADNLLEWLGLTEDASEQDVVSALGRLATESDAFPAWARPYRSHLAAVAPLAGQETVVAALPWVVRIR